MTIPVQSAQHSATIYADLSGLEKLRHGADADAEKSLRIVAEQFEAMLIQMMLESAKGFDDEEDGLFDSEQTDFYQDWHDKQLALNLADGQGIGIADLLVEQLRRSVAPNTTPNTMLNNGAEENQSTAAAQDNPNARFKLSAVTKPESAQIDGSALARGRLPASPEEFVRQLYPLAKEAASEIGVAPDVLIAQAALETGWGQKVAATAQGASSYNLFNIKADRRWQGESVSVLTSEYSQGVKRPERAEFRAYDSYESSFADYVDFIKHSERYRNAVAVAGDGSEYAQELARAGYATDPQYASKIIRILNSEQFQSALDPIKV